jgi:hypothetical protein
MRFYLAQVNIALMRAELDTATMNGMADRISDMNTLAERTPGFVWRFQTSEPPEVYLRPFETCTASVGWDRIFYNMSVWESVEHLKAYVYKTLHIEMLKQKDEWILPSTGPHLALWWVPTGHRPTVAESKAKLDTLSHEGPSPAAFTFARPFSPLNVGPAGADALAR